MFFLKARTEQTKRRSPQQTPFPKNSVQSTTEYKPTESVGRQELDDFIDAMKSINKEAQENPQLVIDAPHTTRIGRLDEATAARKPILRWKPDMEATAKTA